MYSYTNCMEYSWTTIYIYIFWNSSSLFAWQLTIPQASSRRSLLPVYPQLITMYRRRTWLLPRGGSVGGGLVFWEPCIPQKNEIDDKMLCFFFRWVCKFSKTTNKVYGGVLSVLSDHSTSIGHLSVLLCHLWKPKWRSPQKEGWSRGLKLCDSTKVFKTAADFAFSGANLPWKRSLLVVPFANDLGFPSFATELWRDQLSHFGDRRLEIINRMRFTFWVLRVLYF